MNDNKEKSYMIVQDGCGVCKEAKEKLKESIKQEKIIVLDIGSEKGAELANKYKISHVPVIINNEDKFQQKCLISKDYDKIFCEDGTEKELIKKSE